MPSFFRWPPRAKTRYLPLNNDPIEMADHTVVPTTAHDDARDSSLDKREFSTDLTGGTLPADTFTRKNETSVLPGYQNRDSTSTLDGEQPDDVSEEDLATLKRVSDRIPLSAWFVVVVELCERFTFYGLSPPFQNYIQNGPNDDPKGYLALGQTGATGLGNFFQFCV
jgi:proton-dependent oligopeptide transporter, POT family